MGNWCCKGRSGLETAVPAQYNGIAQNQQTSHATIENRDCYHCNSLETAASVSCVKHYLQYAKGRDEHCGNEFHTAVKKGHSNMIRLLAQPDRNIDINECDYYQLTPLMVSVIYSRIKCILVLLECGANMEIKDTEGKTVMDYILEKYREEGKSVL